MLGRLRATVLLGAARICSLAAYAHSAYILAISKTGGRHCSGAAVNAAARTSIYRHCELRARLIIYRKMKSQNCYDGSMFRLKT